MSVQIHLGTAAYCVAMVADTEEYDASLGNFCISTSCAGVPADAAGLAFLQDMHKKVSDYSLALLNFIHGTCYLADCCGLVGGHVIVSLSVGLVGWVYRWCRSK